MVNKQLDIVHKFLSSCKSKVSFLRVPEYVLSELKKEDFVVIDAALEFSPYKPFLSILTADDISIDMDFVRENSYSMQKDTFVSYFEKGMADLRYDIPLGNEEKYEQKRFIQTIIELLKRYTTKKYLVLNAQCLSAESVELIRLLLDTEIQSRFVFCFSSFNNEMEPSAVFRFEEEIKDASNYLHLVSPLISISKDKVEYNTILDLPEENQYEEIFRILRNNYIFMMREQLKDFLLWVSANYSKLNLYEDQRRELCLELGRALISCGLLDEAILYLNDIIDMQMDDEIHSIALYHLTCAFEKKKSPVLAQKYFALAEKAFEASDNKIYLALCSILDFNIARTNSAEDTVKKYQKCTKLLEEQGFINNLISISLSIPWKLISDEGARDALEAEIDKCLELAKKIDNQHLISSACHWKGIICSHYGEADKAIKWYDKCNEIRTQIGEIGPILNIRNGLCYDANCRAMYKRGYDLVNGIISKLNDINDVATITDTLKNIGYSLFYSRHFTEAYEIFNIITHYLTVFKMSEMLNSSFLPSLSDMLMFKSIINFDSGDYIRARVNHSNIMQNLNTLSKEDIPFVYFIESVLHIVDNELVYAEKLFEHCIEEFNHIKSKMNHKVVFANYEFAVMLHRFGYDEQAEKYMKTGYELAEKEGYMYYMGKKVVENGEVISSSGDRNCLTVQEYIDGVEEFDPLNVNLSNLMAKAEKEQILILLHKKIHDYQLINKIKGGKGTSTNERQYVQSILFDLAEYTLCDRIYYAFFENGSYKCYDSISNKKSAPLAQSVWESLFEQSKKSENAQLVYNSDVGVYFGNCSYLKYKFGIVIITPEDKPLSVDIINTVNIALSSIQSQVVIFKQEENLMIMSSTDQLSCLKNRHAFQECIAIESERVRRYQQRKDTVIQIAVAFIDLDNFKYYNDTFGHNVGDLLIKNFANLLRETCRKIDFISRYGGDEFVIIMIDTNADEGRRVFQRLNENLEKNNYFLPDIMELLELDSIDIPENRRIGFSMGISTNHDIEKCDNLDLVVQNADKALYYTKEHCKGGVTVWSTIKDKV